ncbi:MAG: DUF177 domain-containing protein [Candidatus Omnitrophica bacterium]|nr:DUF177 domain-containing protein [Candidatus Omnitrophota bacterium]
MKIAIKDIPLCGLEIDGILEKEDFTFDGEDIQCLAPVCVSAYLECIGNVVSAKASVKANFSVLCGRCLRSFEKEIVKDLVFHYDLEEHPRYIELGEDVRQEILLDFPSKILCADDCKGICSSCGMDLNSEKCSCNRRNSI